MTAMNTTIASLQTTVATQATTIVSIQTTNNFCGELNVISDHELALMAPSTATCGTIGGTLTIQSAVTNGTLLAEAFHGLRVVAGGIYIVNNPNLVSLDGTFPQLQTVGSHIHIRNNARLASIEGAFPQLRTMINDGIAIYDNPVLATIDGSFQNLQTVGADLRLSNNWLLTSIGSSFSSLQSVGGLMFYTNGVNSPQHVILGQPHGGSAAFCASAASALCPSTTNWGPTCASCCNAYCATTTAC